ncbi:MAG: SRPBCC family protein [Actinomycetota bacterium]
MIEVEATVDIDRPATEVFAFLADMANNPRWQQGMERCTWTSDPPLRLGSTYDQEASFLGRSIVSSFEVVEFVDGERIRIITTGGTMPIDVTRTVTAIDDERSRAAAVVRGEPGGWMRAAGPLMRILVGSSVRRDYRRLKELLEDSTRPD